MGTVKLHLDADASMRTLHAALLERGHDVTRTPNEWMPSPTHLAVWSGATGLVPLGYPRALARVLIDDIESALAGE